ncbi:MAG: hypothetical protein ABIS36_10935 [Chryseolinea sp.]
MSKIIDNPLLVGATGTFAGVFVYRRVRGNVVMAKRPTRTKPQTETQIVTQTAFQKAARYAKFQIRKPEVKEVYAEGITSKKHSAFLVAVSDALRSPEISPLDLKRYTGAVGDAILIEAHDDFRVTAVSVEIQDPNGITIERGAASAIPELFDTWTYTITVLNATPVGSKLIVTATDFANNNTIEEFIK